MAPFLFPTGNRCAVLARGEPRKIYIVGGHFMKRKLLSILLTLCLAFSLLPTAALADGEGTQTNDVAQIGGTGYATLQAAIDAAKSGDTIVLKKSISATEIGEKKQLQFVKADMNVTLDLNQNTITAEAGEAIAINAANITLTVKNGTIENFAEGSYSDGVYAYKESNNLTLTFENIVLKSRTQGLAVQGLTSNSNVNIVNSNITSTEGLGIYYPPKSGTLTISDSEITGVTGIVVKGSNLVVNGEKTIISGTGPNVDPETYYTGATDGSSTLTETGDAVYVESGYNDRDISVSISGGHLNSKNAKAVRMFVKNGENTSAKREISVTGGTFSSDVSAYVAKGYVQNENGTVEQLGETNAVAKVGDTYYKTLADAVAAVQNGDTITLLKDVDLGNTVTVANKTVTLNMAGKTIYNTKNLWDSKLNAWSLISVRENGDLTITGDGTLKAKADDCYALDTQEGSAKLTVENGTVIGNISAIYAFLGEVTINGGSYSIQQLNTNNVQDGYGLTINCYDQNYKEKTAKITVTGGYFAHFDPANNKAEGVGTNFVKDGYVSVTSDKSGYDYKVVKKTDTGSIVVKPAVAEPEVNVSDKISENDKPAVENAAKSVAVPTLGAAATAQAQQIDAEKAAALIAKVTEVNKDNAKLYVQVSLKVAPTAYTDTTGNKELALEITPQYRIVASTANKADDIKLSGSSKNAQVVQDYQNLTITAPTVVTMELPTGFANDGDKLSIKHTKGNGTVEYYTGIVTETSGTKTLTFTTNGFSPFVISSAVASIDGVMYPTLAEAVANVDSGKTIKLETDCAEAVTVSRTVKFTLNKNSHAFTGSIKAGSYTTVTATDTEPVEYTFIYSRPSSGSSSYDPTYSVSTPSKTEHGTVTVSPKSASKGDTVTVTVKPDSGYVLETLTVTDKNGNELTLKDKGNGKYTFTMPAGKVEVKATFMEDNSMLNFFYDVPNNAYFYEAVKWAVKNGITDGVGNNLFAPEQPCTRAQIVTFLWRAAGSPEPKGTAAGMTDVVPGSYYEKAVAWAIENGITTGTTTTTFSPDATCTRAQAVTFLARALKAKAASAAEFSDVPTGSYFADAVAWAAANGVTEGIGGGLFGSDNDCTRGQIVTFLYRAYNK